MNISACPNVRLIFDKRSGGQAYCLIPALLVLDNHSMPEQPHATNTSCHQLSFNAVKVYEITTFICLHIVWLLYFQRSPSFKIFWEHCYESWKADLLKTWYSRRDCTDNQPHPDLFKKFQFTVFAFYCCFISVTSRHCSPDSCRFMEMRISKIFKEWQEQLQVGSDLLCCSSYKWHLPNWFAC